MSRMGYVRDSTGGSHSLRAFHVNVSGHWHPVKKAWVKDAANKWRQWWPPDAAAKVPPPKKVTSGGHTSTRTYHRTTISATHRARVIVWKVASGRHVTKQVITYYTGSSLRRVRHTMAVSAGARSATITQHATIVSAQVTYTYY